MARRELRAITAETVEVLEDASSLSKSSKFEPCQKNLAYDLVQIHSGGSPEANRFPARASPTALTAFDIMIRFSLHCYYELEDSD